MKQAVSWETVRLPKLHLSAILESGLPRRAVPHPGAISAKDCRVATAVSKTLDRAVGMARRPRNHPGYFTTAEAETFTTSDSPFQAS